MSFTRRLAAGLSVAGVTAFAALALTGAPAAAAGEEAATRLHLPVAMATPSCATGERDEDCGYGTAVPTDEAPTRGNGGYGSEAPTTAPTPSASVDTVPPTSPAPSGGVSPATSPSTGGGVSPAGTLPLTGAPMGLIIAVGAVLVAGGAGAVYASRRRHA